MVKRTSLEDATCPIARSLDVIGDWWSLLIVRDAMLGKRRFGEFQKSLGVAKNILSARLKTLVDQGILEMVPAADGSAYHDYVLTARGQSLHLVISALRQWGEENMFAPGEPCPVLVDAKNGKPVRKLELRAADGRVLGPGETRLRA
jgi:DNA-binding HxlR family transcriptional regulator